MAGRVADSGRRRGVFLAGMVLFAFFTLETDANGQRRHRVDVPFVEDPAAQLALAAGFGTVLTVPASFVDVLGVDPRDVAWRPLTGATAVPLCLLTREDDTSPRTSALREAVGATPR